MAELCKLLKRIIENNKDTDCGRSFGFADIKSLEDFEKQVPLTDYYYYFPLIELTTRVGEKDIFVNGPIVGYTLSSSAIGKNKEFPCTKEHIAEYVKLFDKPEVKGSTFLMMESMPKNTKFADGSYLDSIWGIALHEAEKKFADTGLFKKKKYTSPKELIVTNEVIDSLHIRLLFALADRNVEQITAPFMWGIWEICNYLDTNSQLLLDDLKKGKISQKVTVSDELRDTLNKKLSVSQERIDELTDIFADDDRTGLLKKIWPELQKITAFYSGEFGIYRENILPYVGFAQICNGPMLSPEGLVGIPVEGTDYHELCTKNVYAEFKDPDSDSVVRVSDAVPGRSYEIIITNSSGLYRFRTGDIVTIISNDSEKCIFEYAYRKTSDAVVNGTALNAVQVMNAVTELKRETGADITDYCYFADEENERFDVFVEINNADSSDSASIIPGNSSELVDKYLGESNSEYKEALENNDINPCELHVLEPQTQLLFRDVVKFKKRTAPDYIKPVRKIKTIEEDRFFSRQSIL